jgi:dipeptidyl aminopeptidase/acylaminoacyl peptidase
MLYGRRIKLPLAGGAIPPIKLANQMACSVLGLVGNDDQNASLEDVDELDAALSRAGFQNVFHLYDGAGHGLQDD